ncbi:MAG: type II toxin-antitoxin system VapC family toxin [Candidatus Dadabacteria bacterium]|nr:type II toxin-antitoxin system VapC family toxin [Candidatus Dadabacteria bacterium]MCY4047943.1 type II toxin-antitoxin system VapC family toxin [Candidatus Dadabacteria bacterium]
MLRLLIDTHALLWWFEDSKKIGKQTDSALRNGENEIFVSAVTGWEIAIKSNLGKLKAPPDLESVILKDGFDTLPLTFFHARRAGELPLHHRDPFDRMLVAQAQAEGLTIVTRDEKIALYGVSTLDARE